MLKIGDVQSGSGSGRQGTQSFEPFLWAFWAFYGLSAVL